MDIFLLLKFRPESKRKKLTQRRDAAKNPQSFLYDTFAARRLCVQALLFIAAMEPISFFFETAICAKLFQYPKEILGRRGNL